MQWLTVQIRTGRSAAVHGELGIGKSALLRAAAEAEGRRTLVGGGLAHLAWSPYLPLVRAIRVPLPAGDRALVAAYVAHRVRDGLLLLDDLQHADRDTLAVLPAIAERVCLMLAWRDGEPGSQRAMAVARACGCEILRLDGLSHAAATQLVRTRRSTVTELEARALASSCGGNPLLLEESTRGDAGTSSIAAVVQRCLAPLSPAAREGVAALGLLGRGAPAELLGDATGELLDAALVEDEGGLLTLRRPVFGEIAIEQLDPQSRRRLHARLARRLADPGERARHLAAAGDLQAAGAAALEAARTTRHAGERGRHLELAAQCASGAQADRLRLAAAELLADAGEHELAERVLSRIEAGDGPEAAEASLRRARALLALGARREAHAAAVDGLALLRDPGPLQLQLRVERLRAELASGRPAATLLEEAAEVAGLCELASVAEARAAAMLGSIQLAAGAAAWIGTLQRSLKLARLADEFDVECAAAATVVLGHLLAADVQSAREVAQEMEDRCAARLLRGAQLQFAASRLWLDLHGRGACAEVAQTCRALLADPAPEPVVGQLQGLMALALADAGELREAELVIEHALARASVDRGRYLSWTRAEVMWLAGDGAGSTDLACECRDDPLCAFPVGALAAVTAAWAQSDAGGQARGAGIGQGSQVCGGSEEELAGIGLLAEDPAAARERFVDAGQAWTGIERRGALRCAWAGAEAARRAGDRDAAIAALRDARSEMTAAGITAIVSRVNRSLREAGVREASGRSADERGLTAREREILTLVAQGLSTAAIARRLGLEAATVETHIESAREKLGAANRTQAAILACS